MASCISHLISIVIIFLILIVKCKAQVGHLLSIGQDASALFAFGDSILDCGTGTEVMVLPYGIDAGYFPGRFTNGYTIGDELGLYLNLSETYPYWVTSTLGDSAPLSMKGFCYASGRAGLLPTTGSISAKNLNMPKQIEMFDHDMKDYFTKILHNAGETSKYISKSVFAISVGGNDYLENYGNGHKYNHSGKSYNMDEFSTLLMSELQKIVVELYRLGARMIIVFEIGPIGCYPLMVGKDKPIGWCSNELNDMISVFNGKLYHKLIEFSSTLEGTTFFIAKTFTLIYDMLEYPKKYNLGDGRNPCCKVNETEGVFKCIPDQPPCERRDQHLFFDKKHLTSKANKLIASKCLTDSSICLPIIYQKFEGTFVILSGQPGDSRNGFLCIFLLFLQLLVFTILHYFS